MVRPAGANHTRGRRDGGADTVDALFVCFESLRRVFEHEIVDFFALSAESVERVEGPAAEIYRDGDRKKDHSLDHDIDETIPCQPGLNLRFKNSILKNILLI